MGALGRDEVRAAASALWRPEGTDPDPEGCVLVAVEDPELRRQICDPLRHHGFDVMEASSAAAALELVRRRQVDVAVVDIDRSGIDGPELLRHWREICAGRYVPVLLLTVRATLDDIGAAIHLGAHDYLLPPFEPVDVLARVHSALEGKRRHDAFRRRVTELQQLVRTDALTGLYNRRHMDSELAALASAARRQRTPLGVLLIDIDRFKRINDRLSHEAGDNALRAVAHRIRSGVRIEDVVGRWGGDEFVVILPSTDQDAALVLAERLRREVATPAAGDPPAPPLTVSVGCAAADDPEESALISAADAGLRRAKAGGRNRVGVAPLPQASGAAQ